MTAYKEYTPAWYLTVADAVAKKKLTE